MYARTELGSRVFSCDTVRYYFPLLLSCNMPLGCCTIFFDNSLFIRKIVVSLYQILLKL